MSTPDITTDLLHRVNAAYSSLIVRSYVRVRFEIINIDLLRRLNQALPAEGRMLDVGCGFGLFSLILAQAAPERQIVGLDLNPRRIEQARQVARKLHLDNVEFHSADITKTRLDGQWNAIFVLDLLHHITPLAKCRFLRAAHNHLDPGGTLVIKDITTTPTYKLFYTWLLDKLMVGTEPVYYQHHRDYMRMLNRYGFSATSSIVRDRMPYPHVIFRCKKR